MTFRDEQGMRASDDELRYLFLFAYWRRQGIVLDYVSWGEVRVVDWQPDHVVVEAPQPLVESVQMLVSHWRDDFDVYRYALLFTQIGWMRERPRYMDTIGRMLPPQLDYLQPDGTLSDMPRVFAPGLAVLPRLTAVA